MKPFLVSLPFLICAVPLGAVPLGDADAGCTNATVLTAGVHTGLHLHDDWSWNPVTQSDVWDTEIDWYRISVLPGQVLAIYVSVTAIQGQLWFVSSSLGQAAPVSCVNWLQSGVLQLTVVNTNAVPTEYILSVSALSGLPQTDLDLDYDLDVQLSPQLIQPYCPAAINSLGLPCVLTVQGWPSVSANNLAFTASNVHAFTPAQLFDGTVQMNIPFGDGRRCVGGMVFRLALHPANASGNWVTNLDLGALPGPAAILPGSTWNFQLLYRDLNGPLGMGFNLSSAVSLTFVP